MSTKPSFNLIELQEPFGRILSIEDFGEPVNDIAELIYLGQFSQRNQEDLLLEHGINDLNTIKAPVLDMIICYINVILDDNYITAKEAENVRYLKRFFKIKEGDFFSKKYFEIGRILDRQFEYMYQNNKIDHTEALQKVQLQGLFDLSYDQFLKLSDKAVKSAISRGADQMDLDTFIKI
jgi:hypothetical protein